MRYLTPIAALFLAFLPTSASADCANQTCTDVVVTRFFVNQNNLFVRTTGDETLLTCDPATGLYLRMARSHVAYEDWYALVLTAFVERTPITFAMQSGTGLCYVEYVMQDK